MVTNLCPHCEGPIELDSDAPGKFECPHCGREFEWNINDDDSTIADPGSGKFASVYAWLLNKASLAVTPLPLIWALVLLPISLLAGLVSDYPLRELFHRRFGSGFVDVGGIIEI